MSDFYWRFCSIVLGAMAETIPVVERADCYPPVPKYIVNIAQHTENLVEKRHLEPIRKELAATNEKLRRCLKKYWANKEKAFFKRANKAMLFRHIAHHLRPKTNEVQLLGSDGELVKTDDEKAALLATHFASVYQDGARTTPRRTTCRYPKPSIFSRLRTAKFTAS